MTRPPLDGQGCTPERKRLSHVNGTVREVTPDGMVLSYGDTDTEHCYLDWLLGHGLLGRRWTSYPLSSPWRGGRQAFRRLRLQPPTRVGRQ
jgi:hypothetical protein